MDKLISHWGLEKWASRCAQIEPCGDPKPEGSLCSPGSPRGSQRQLLSSRMETTTWFLQLRENRRVIETKPRSEGDPTKCRPVTWAPGEANQAHRGPAAPCSPKFNPDVAIKNGHFRRCADGQLEDKFQAQTQQGGPISPSFAPNNYVVVHHHTYIYEPCKCRKKTFNVLWTKQSFRSLARKTPFCNTLVPYQWCEYEPRIKEMHKSRSPLSGWWKIP